MAKPIRKFSAGTVNCALWENDMPLPKGGSKTMLSATVERRYKNREGEWKSSNSFGRNEIALVKWCLDQAFDVMVEERRGNGAEEEVVR